jgi:FtsH-binding integral membrane protein
MPYEPQSHPVDALRSRRRAERRLAQPGARNTYALLALSMVPTVLGAWIGVTTGFSFFAGNPFIGFIAFMAIAFGFFFAIEKYKNSAMGVALLLGFTFFMGLMLSRLIGHVLGYSNGASLIMTAFGGTSVIFGVMATVATVSKRDFTGMGKFLFVGVLVLIVAALANVFLQMPALMLTISVLAIGIFSAFHPGRPAAGRSGRRDELRDGHARRLPERLQRVLEPAGAAGDLRRRPRVERQEPGRPAAAPTGFTGRPSGRLLFVRRPSARNRAPARRSTRRARSAGTC